VVKGGVGERTRAAFFPVRLLKLHPSCWLSRGWLRW
jgi:hypothetical protein